MNINISQLDHLVLTVASIETSCEFYERVLGMEVITFGTPEQPRKALRFGSQKINLHEAGGEFTPHAQQPVPGSADLCFICDSPLGDIIEHLKNQGSEIILGPVGRTGATGPIMSVYIRDPDSNLIELSNLV